MYICEVINQEKKTVATTWIVVPEHQGRDITHLDMTCKRGEAELILGTWA